MEKIKRKIEENISSIIGKLIPENFDLNRNDRSDTLYKSWGYVMNSRMRGVYYEFGVYHGGSFRESYKLYQKYNGWMKLQSIYSEAWRLSYSFTGKVFYSTC